MIALNQLTVRHERRVRVLFTEALGAGAFAPALYSLALGSGASGPPVVGAIVIVGTPIAVELALGADLQDGGSYVLTASGVPALDGSVTPPGSAFAFVWNSGAAPTNVELPEDDLDALLYGIDLVWTGTDFGETPLGDLATDAQRLGFRFGGKHIDDFAAHTIRTALELHLVARVLQLGELTDQGALVDALALGQDQA